MVSLNKKLGFYYTICCLELKCDKDNLKHYKKNKWVEFKCNLPYLGSGVCTFGEDSIAFVPDKSGQVIVIYNKGRRDEIQ